MKRDDELDRELRFHIDARIDDLVAEGVTVEEARRRAAGIRRRDADEGGGP